MTVQDVTAHGAEAVPCSLHASHVREGAARLLECRNLAGSCQVFRDRAHAGGVLAQMLREASIALDLVLAVPAGGVPVACAITQALKLPLDVAVVSKVTLPWNTEAGYGAVAFDGSVLLNEDLIRRCGLSPLEVEHGVAFTRRKVERRSVTLRRGLGGLALSGKSVALVDDGLASGFTMRAAIAAVRRQGALRVIVAVPTAHTGAIERVLGDLDLLVCANVRGGGSFAVADAYDSWQDVPEALAEIALERARRAGLCSPLA